MVTSTSPPAASRMRGGGRPPRELHDRVRAAARAAGRGGRSARAAATTRPAPSSFAACTAMLPTAPSRAEHEHRLARLQPERHASASHAPRPVLPSAAATRVVDALGDVEQRVLGDERPLGHRAVRRHGDVEVDAPPVTEPADAVGPDHRGQRRRAGVERAGRLVEVEVMQRGGGDLDHGGAGGLAGVGELA